MGRDKRPASGTVHYDVVVVGGGPGGLVTARELARAGARVAIVDEAAELGGQYFKRRRGEVLERHGDYRPKGSLLIGEVRRLGVACLTSRLVWGVDSDGTLMTTSTVVPDSLRIMGAATVIATGATEHVSPFPGWDLPGVMTPGHAMHLATTDVVQVGQRVLLAGSGPFLLPVACSLLDAGTNVVGVVEAGNPYRPAARSLRAAAYPSMVAEFARYMSKLVRHRVPIMQGAHVTRAEGRNAVEAVVVAQANRPAREQEFAVDTLAVGFGFKPTTDLLQLLDVACGLDPVTGVPVPITDEFGRTSRSGVYAVGEARGIAGNAAAQVRGWLAAEAIKRASGLQAAPTRTVRAQLRRAERFDTFAKFSVELFSHDRTELLEIPDQTVVCRCEAVTAGQIRDAALLGWNDRNAVKGATRAGMGPCQGRECATAVGCLVSALTGEAVTVQPARIPVKPISVRAAMAVEDLEVNA